MNAVDDNDDESVEIIIALLSHFTENVGTFYATGIGTDPCTKTISKVVGSTICEKNNLDRFVLEIGVFLFYFLGVRMGVGAYNLVCKLSYG